MFSDALIRGTAGAAARLRQSRETGVPLAQVSIGTRASLVPPELADLTIEPWSDEQVNPASYDLTLSSVFRVFPGVVPEVIDVADVHEGHTERVVAPTPGDESFGWETGVAMGVTMRPDGGVVLAPGAFLLGATREVVSLPRGLAARVEGKSSLGRIGLTVHVTAGFIDPGFKGSITLEIANLSGCRHLVLRPGMRIAQIAFTPMVGWVERSYQTTGHYQDQPAGEPIESRYAL